MAKKGVRLFSAVSRERLGGDEGGWGGEREPVSIITVTNTTFFSAFRRPWLYPDFIFFYLSRCGRRFAKNCDFVHDFANDIIQNRRKVLVSKTQYS